MQNLHGRIRLSFRNGYTAMKSRESIRLSSRLTAVRGSCGMRKSRPKGDWSRRINSGRRRRWLPRVELSSSTRSKSRNRLKERTATYWRNKTLNRSWKNNCGKLTWRLEASTIVVTQGRRLSYRSCRSWMSNCSSCGRNCGAARCGRRRWSSSYCSCRS